MKSLKSSLFRLSISSSFSSSHDSGLLVENARFCAIGTRTGEADRSWSFPLLNRRDRRTFLNETEL